MVWTRDGKELNDDAKVVEILGSDRRRRPERFVVTMGVVIVRHDEQPSREKIWRLGGKDLVGAEENVRHGDSFCGWNEHISRFTFIFGQRSEVLHFPSGWNVQVREEIAMGV